MNATELLASIPRDHRTERGTRRMWSAMLLGLLCATLLPTAAAQAATAAPSSAEVAQRTTATTLSADYFERRLFARTNLRREARGCRPLRLDAALALAARRHSTLMVLQSSLSHRLTGEPDLSVRAPNAGYTHWRILAENLAWGQSTPRQVFRDWVASPPHRANLDNCRLRDVGIAVVFANGRPWVTADYGRHF
jgi:uncharacterized protein YkwD